MTDLSGKDSYEWRISGMDCAACDCQLPYHRPAPDRWVGAATLVLGAVCLNQLLRNSARGAAIAPARWGGQALPAPSDACYGLAYVRRRMGCEVGLDAAGIPAASRMVITGAGPIESGRLAVDQLFLRDTPPTASSASTTRPRLV